MASIRDRLRSEMQACVPGNTMACQPLLDLLIPFQELGARRAACQCPSREKKTDPMSHPPQLVLDLVDLRFVHGRRVPRTHNPHCLVNPGIP